MGNEWVTVNVNGLDVLQKKLEELPETVSAEVIHEGLKNAADGIRDEFILTAPDPDMQGGGVSRGKKGVVAAMKVILGHLKNKSSWRFKWRRKPEDLAASVYVMPSGRTLETRQSGRTKGLPRTAAMIVHWLEFGTKSRTKHPFMTAGWEAGKNKAFATIVDSIRAALERLGK